MKSKYFDLGYFKHLFISKESSLNRSECLAAIGLLWFISFFSIQGTIFSFLLNSYAIPKLGPEIYGRYSVVNNMMSIVWDIGVPWRFLLLVGSILFTVRLFRYPLIVKILIGILIYSAFKILQYIFLIPGVEEYSEMLSDYINPNILLIGLVIIIIPGITFLFLSYFGIKKTDSPNKTIKLYSKEKFTKHLFLFSITLNIIQSVFVILLINKNLSDSYKEIIVVIASILSLTAFVVFLVLYISRIKSSRFNLLYLFWFFGPILTMSGTLIIILTSTDVWIISPARILFFFSLLASQLGIVGLMFSKDKEINGKEEILITTTNIN